MSLNVKTMLVLGGSGFIVKALARSEQSAVAVAEAGASVLSGIQHAAGIGFDMGCTANCLKAGHRDGRRQTGPGDIADRNDDPSASGNASYQSPLTRASASPALLIALKVNL
jgi:hypothetical protein